MTASVTFRFPDPESPEYKPWIRRLFHGVRQLKAKAARTERLARIEKKRARRKHRAAFRRRKAGIA